MDTKSYDLICSLGGNCSAAHNLLIRGLRLFALPFDWRYFENDDALLRLAYHFKNNFKEFALKNNLTRLKENPEHRDKIQYKDNYSGYILANHFVKSIEEGGYDEVNTKLRRRIRRLLTSIKSGHKILFILSTSFEVNISSIQILSSTLQTLYPEKN